MKIQKRSVFWFVTVGMIFALVTTNNLNFNPGFPEAAAQTPILLGALHDSSGGAALFSEPVVRGLELAIEEINRTGGIMGRPVKLLKQDDANNPNVSPMRTRALIEEGAVALFMTSGSASTLQARVILEEKKIPGMNSTNLNPKVYMPPYNSYIFVIGVDAVQVVKALVESLRPYKRVAIFTDNSPTGAGLGETYKNSFGKAGINIIMVEAVDVGATDATAQVARIKAANAEAVFVTGQAGPEHALFLRTAHMQGFDVPMFMDTAGPMPQWWPLAGAEGLKNLNFIDLVDPDNKLTLKVQKLFEAKYGTKQPFTCFSAQGWDMVYMYKQAIESAGSTNGTDIRNALEKGLRLESHWGQPGFFISCSKDNHHCSSMKGLVLRGFEGERPGPVIKRFN
jgi:branched-chain amino acid transport system substrate-binding protein